MLNLEPFVYINKIVVNDIDKVREYFEKLLLQKNNTEGYHTLESSEEIISINYYKVMNTFDFSFDKQNNKIISEETPKIMNAELRLNLENQTLIVWGKPSVIKFINKILQDRELFQVKSNGFEFESFYKNFSECKTEITEVAFNDIRVLNKYIPVATLSTTSNNDALYLIGNLGARVSRVKIRIFSKEDEFVELDTNLEDGVIKFNFQVIDRVFIEEIKEKINKLKLV
ncbi:hypothetical protein [Bacillus cereus]|uniref:hypothetical protein n=1 Tax=Bacillus cereus TaxID=1396 RepID=UPI000E6CF16A|nr:hypothetical protein [Bacillus cereus]RJE13270.1 hypothetical protein C0U42_16410 [Bacillus cereus]